MRQYLVRFQGVTAPMRVDILADRRVWVANEQGGGEYAHFEDRTTVGRFFAMVRRDRLGMLSIERVRG